MSSTWYIKTTQSMKVAISPALFLTMSPSYSNPKLQSYPTSQFSKGPRSRTSAPPNAIPLNPNRLSFSSFLGQLLPVRQNTFQACPAGPRSGSHRCKFGAFSLYPQSSLCALKSEFIRGTSYLLCLYHLLTMIYSRLRTTCYLYIPNNLHRYKHRVGTE